MDHNKKKHKITDTTNTIHNPIEIPEHEIKNEPLENVLENEIPFRMDNEVKRSKSSNTFCLCDEPSLPVSGDGWFLEDDPNLKCRECGLKIKILPELLKKIVTCAMLKNDGKLDLIVRIIQKSWLSTTTKLLRNLGKPVNRLSLDEENSLEESSVVRKEGKLLNRFIQTFTTGQRIVESTILFSLDLSVEYFCEENYVSLSDCLHHLGSSLCALQISYPKDGGTLPVNFPNLNLSSLTKLSFQFSDKSLVDEEANDDDVAPFGNNVRGLWLLQAILNATANLEEFVHPFTTFPVDIPPDFEFLRLPPTLTTLDLNMRLRSKDLKVLLRNDLPNLTCLTLLLNDTPFEDDLLYQILERMRNTLTSFEIEGLSKSGNSCPHTHLRFPAMELLEKISIGGTCCELGPGEFESDLHECLPYLKSLKVVNQTKIAFKKWIGKSSFLNVEDLEVSVVNEHLKEENQNKSLSLDMKLVKGMHKAFPNVQELNITFNVSNMTGLNCIFQNMTQLVMLNINLRGNLDNYSSEQFDSKFLSLPLALLTTLKKYDELFQNVEFKSSGQASIRNLTALTKLVLWTPTIPEDEEGSFLSEMLIKHGLLKMPTLHCVELHEKFKPTPNITKLWEDEGRSMKYHHE